MQREASLEHQEREKKALKPIVTGKYTQNTLKGNLVDSTLEQVENQKAGTSTKPSKLFGLGHIWIGVFRSPMFSCVFRVKSR